MVHAVGCSLPTNVATLGWRVAVQHNSQQSEVLFIDTLVETFGPFLIPATLFALGAIGYLFLWLLTRSRRETYTADDQ